MNLDIREKIFPNVGGEATPMEDCSFSLLKDEIELWKFKRHIVGPVLQYLGDLREAHHQIENKERREDEAVKAKADNSYEIRVAAKTRTCSTMKVSSGLPRLTIERGF